MNSRRLRKTFAIFMLTIILSWTVLPGIAMADWLKAGKAIDITNRLPAAKRSQAVKSFTGGEFMVPGEVFTYGKPFKGTFSL